MITELKSGARTELSYCFNSRPTWPLELTGESGDVILEKALGFSRLCNESCQGSFHISFLCRCLLSNQLILIEGLSNGLLTDSANLTFPSPSQKQILHPVKDRQIFKHVEQAKTHMRLKWTLFNMGQTKQCAHFQQILPSTIVCLFIEESYTYTL